jgi:lysozyme family protein
MELLYLETVLRCKAAFYISDWSVSVSIWRAESSNSYTVGAVRMTPCVSKRFGEANITCDLV